MLCIPSLLTAVRADRTRFSSITLRASSSSFPPWDARMVDRPERLPASATAHRGDAAPRGQRPRARGMRTGWSAEAFPGPCRPDAPGDDPHPCSVERTPLAAITGPGGVPMTVIAAVAEKGGVGRTALSCILAAGLSQAGARVLLVVLDVQVAGAAVFLHRPARTPAEHRPSAAARSRGGRRRRSHPRGAPCSLAVRRSMAATSCALRSRRTALRHQAHQPPLRCRHHRCRRRGAAPSPAPGASRPPTSPWSSPMPRATRASAASIA